MRSAGWPLLALLALAPVTPAAYPPPAGPFAHRGYYLTLTRTPTFGLDAWKKTVERWDSEPETGEGRKELAARAKEAEQKRDRSLAAYHHYEVASGSVLIAIVLASSSIITGIAALVWVAGALGVVGVVFCGIGFFAPLAVHF